MKTQLCSRCNKYRRNNSPVSYVWWHVKGKGLMCWNCTDHHTKATPQGAADHGR